MTTSPAAIGRELDTACPDPAGLLRAVDDRALRRRVAAAWADLAPAEALTAALPDLPEAELEATLRLLDREIRIMPSVGEGVRIEVSGAPGLQALAQVPEALLAATRELFVNRVGPADAALFGELASPARFPALTELGVGGQADLAEAALGLLGSGVVDFTYHARGLVAARVERLAKHPLQRVALHSLDKEAALPLLSMDSLEALELRHCPFAHKHLKQLAALPALRRLTLAMHGLWKATTKTIASFERLESLDVSNNDTVDDASWARLGELPKLQRLVLAGNKVGTKTIEALAAAPLRELHLTRASVASCAALASLASLELLKLEHVACDEAGFAAIGKLAGLRELSLGGAKARERLHHLAGLGRLRVLDLSGSGLRAEDVAPLADMPGLRRLDLQGNPALTAAGIARLAGLELAALNVSRCNVGNQGLAFLAKLSTLEWLAITQNGIDDAAPLQQLRSLRWLHMGKNPVAASIEAIGRLPLVELYAEGCALDDGLGAVVARIVTLRRLFAWENRVGDGAVESLSAMKQLRIVNMVGNRLGDDAKRTLVRALPDCLWEW